MKILTYQEWADWFDNQSAGIQHLTALVLKSLVEEKHYRVDVAANAIYQIVSQAKPITLGEVIDAPAGPAN